MKYERERAQQFHEAFNLPVRGGWRKDFHYQELKTCRHAIKSGVDVLRAGLNKLDLVTVASGVAQTMYITAGTSLRLGVNPQVENLKEAAMSLITYAESLCDNAIKTKQVYDVRTTMCMIEVVCRGIAAVLGMPYGDLIDEVHRSYMSKLDPEGKPIFSAQGEIQNGPGYTPANIARVLGMEPAKEPPLHSDAQVEIVKDDTPTEACNDPTHDHT